MKTQSVLGWIFSLFLMLIISFFVAATFFAASAEAAIVIAPRVFVPMTGLSHYASAKAEKKKKEKPKEMFTCESKNKCVVNKQRRDLCSLEIFAQKF